MSVMIHVGWLKVPKTVLVTGATRGLGKAGAAGLAQTGATVVMVARDRGQAAAAGGEVRAASHGAEVHILVGDLANIGDTRRIAAEVIARHDGLSLLVNNAGVSKFSREVTEDGLERTFATNHLAPFLLSNLLLEVLARNAPAAILNVASEQHRWLRSIPWDDVPTDRGVQPDKALQHPVHGRAGSARSGSERRRQLPEPGIPTDRPGPGGDRVLPSLPGLEPSLPQTTRSRGRSGDQGRRSRGDWPLLPGDGARHAKPAGQRSSGCRPPLGP